MKFIKKLAELQQLEHKKAGLEVATGELWKAVENLNKKIQKYNFEVYLSPFNIDYWALYFNYEDEEEKKHTTLFQTCFFYSFTEFIHEISMIKILEFWLENEDQRLKDDKHLEKLEKSIEEFKKLSW